MNTTANATTTFPRLVSSASPLWRGEALDSDILPVMLSMVLEGTSGNLATLPYYRKVAQHVHERDPALTSMVSDLISLVRDKYRSARQHEFHAQQVPVTKAVDRRVHAQLDADCAICLRPLKAPGHRLVRLKPDSGSADECAHFFHKDCIGEWELRHLIVPKSCPLCRVDLGLVVKTWEDHEAHRPRF